MVEPVSIDEAFVDIDGLERLFGGPEQIGARVRRRVREALRIPAGNAYDSPPDYRILRERRQDIGQPAGPVGGGRRPVGGPVAQRRGIGKGRPSAAQPEFEVTGQPQVIAAQVRPGGGQRMLQQGQQRLHRQRPAHQRRHLPQEPPRRRQVERLAFDMLYSEPTRECDPPDQDRLLAEAMQRFGAVVMAIERGKLQHLIFDNQVLDSHRALAGLLGAILKLPPVKRVLASKQVKSRYLEALIEWREKRTEHG